MRTRRICANRTGMFHYLLLHSIKHSLAPLDSQGQVAVRLFPKLAAANPDRPMINELAMLGPPLLGSGLMTGLLLWG